MTLLDDIIDAASDPALSAPDLLRKVQVVAHRLGAEDVRTWARNELNGYSDDAPLPEYRMLTTPVQGTFAGPMQSMRPFMLSVIPTGMAEWWEVEIRQPLLEVQALGEGDTDPIRQWPALVVDKYAKTGAIQFEYEHLYSAHNAITRQSLRGVVDVIKTKALDFALELQAAFPDAGEKDGPTVGTEPGLAKTVYNVTNNIYGDGANLAAGPKSRQKSKVTKGDAESLRQAVREVLGDTEAANEFTDAVLGAATPGDEKVKGFLARIRAGSINVAGAIGTGVAADLLLKIAKAYIGG